MKIGKPVPDDPPSPPRPNPASTPGPPPRIGAAKPFVVLPSAGKGKKTQKRPPQTELTPSPPRSRRARDAEEDRDDERAPVTPFVGEVYRPSVPTFGNLNSRVLALANEIVPASRPVGDGDAGFDWLLGGRTGFGHRYFDTDHKANDVNGPAFTGLLAAVGAPRHIVNRPPPEGDGYEKGADLSLLRSAISLGAVHLSRVAGVPFRLKDADIIVIKGEYGPEAHVVVSVSKHLVRTITFGYNKTTRTDCGFRTTLDRSLVEANLLAAVREDPRLLARAKAT